MILSMPSPSAHEACQLWNGISQVCHYHLVLIFRNPAETSSLLNSGQVPQSPRDPCFVWVTEALVPIPMFDSHMPEPRWGLFVNITFLLMIKKSLVSVEMGSIHFEWGFEYLASYFRHLKNWWHKLVLRSTILHFYFLSHCWLRLWPSFYLSLSSSFSPACWQGHCSYTPKRCFVYYP